MQTPPTLLLSLHYFHPLGLFSYTHTHTHACTHTHRFSLLCPASKILLTFPQNSVILQPYPKWSFKSTFACPEYESTLLNKGPSIQGLYPLVAQKKRKSFAILGFPWASSNYMKDSFPLQSFPLLILPENRETMWKLISPLSRITLQEWWDCPSPPPHPHHSLPNSAPYTYIQMLRAPNLSPFGIGANNSVYLSWYSRNVCIMTQLLE